MARGSSDLAAVVADRSAARTVARRKEVYRAEVQRIIDASYRLIARDGVVDPPLRDILRESGLSIQAFYKHFQSKDELMLVLLDDGRRRLVGYLEHRMAKEPDPAGRIRAWIEGVLAQAADPQVAARTRPFLTHQDRLAEQFPAEQRQSVGLLVELLAESIQALPGRRRAAAGRDAQAVYEVAFGTLHRHLSHGSRPSRAEVEHVVRFSLQGVGAS